MHQVKVALERVQDVMDAKPDPVAGATRNCAWTGRVEMRDISFGYAPLERPLSAISTCRCFPVRA